MTRALSRSFPGVSVQEVQIDGARAGTNRSAAVRVACGSGPGPESVFVKMHGGLLNRLALVALRALQAEARLAESGVRLPLESPAMHAAGWDRARLATVVVMEDIAARGGRPNDAARCQSIAEVESGLRGLSRLHAKYWDRPLPAELRFVRPWRLGRSWAAVSAGSLFNGIRRVAQLGQQQLLPRGLTVASLERQFRASARLARIGPQTILHGDPHPGNTYSLPGEAIGFYDWQLVRTGSWSHDVGYFLVGSLAVEDRRRAERDLLFGYLAALAEAGVRPPSEIAAWERYRASPAFGLGTWVHTLSAGRFQPVPACAAMIERFSAAYDDLGTRGSFP